MCINSETVHTTSFVQETASTSLFFIGGQKLNIDPIESEIILGLGELNANGFENTTFTEPIAALVPSIEKARLYRGHGGEIMRGCVCRLIECISLAHIPLSVKQQVSICHEMYLTLS